MNTTTSTSVSTKLNKTYYDRQLLESAKSRFVFSKYGQKRALPLHNGKQVEFRRWELFDPNDAIDGLQEGITPTGQDLTQSNVTADISQYGAYVEVSDVLDMTAYDDVINDSVELLGEQLGTVVEWVTRDAVCAGTNVQYANARTSRNSVTSSDKLTFTEIRKAVRSLKKAKARMFSENGRAPHFICICSPEAVYDLQSDSLWQDVSKYANAEQIYSGEIGRMYGVVFIESTETKTFRTEFTKTTAADCTTTSIKLTTPLTAAQLAYLKSGGKISIGSIHNLSVDTTNAAAGDTAITLSAALDSAPSASLSIIGEDAGADGTPVYTSVVFGKDAYGVISIDGSDTIQSIIKPCGSAGTGDPLNQRATIGAKVAGYAAKILNDLWIVRIEHAASE